jgi:hypothetical protein
VKPSPYPELTTEVRNGIELNFKRVSEFYVKVVLRFVLRDLGFLLDKHGASFGKCSSALTASCQPSGLLDGLPTSPLCPVMLCAWPCWQEGPLRRRTVGLLAS